jgi:hypothetical protein
MYASEAPLAKNREATGRAGELCGLRRARRRRVLRQRRLARVPECRGAVPGATFDTKFSTSNFDALSILTFLSSPAVLAFVRASDKNLNMDRPYGEGE